MLLNPQLLIPPRPTISNLQWISGTQHVSPADMDLLSTSLLPLPSPSPLTNSSPLKVGGPDRPPSKRMLAQMRSEAEQQRRSTAGAQASSSSAANPPYPSAPAAQPEGWGAWASRQFNERTEKLGQVGDSMDSLQQNSAGWASDVNKYVAKQKRGFVLGAVKGKFGL